MSYKERAIWMARFGVLICTIATILGTMNARNGNWGSWALDCAIFAGAAACTGVNYRLARRS